MIRTLTFCISLGVLFLSSVHASAASGGLVFNEIMYALPGSDAGREWIELFNAGQEPVTLVGGGVKETGAWKLLVISGETQETYRLASQPVTGSLTITPGGYLLVAVDAPIFLSEHTTFSGTVVDCCGQSSSARPLRDSAALLQLKNGADEVVSEAYYTNVLGAWENGKTLEYDGSHWRESIRDGGTPGQENSVFGIVLPEAPSPRPPAVLITSPAPTNATSTPPAASPLANASALKNLIISEFLPNPIGEDRDGEWIELANIGSEPISLRGLHLTSDATKKPFLLSGTLPAGSYTIIRRQTSGIVLRNTGGSVQIVGENGATIFEISYNKDLPEGWSAARFGENGWKLTQRPTPGMANVLDAETRASVTDSQIREGEDAFTITPSPVMPPQEGSAGIAHGSLLAVGLTLGAIAAGAAIFLKRRVL
ncbi:MAG: lamin tail domain-containing protein [Parcubacteria group bacterium]|nr:lamin tail domain-containing protein [Parcubacteria group bacterium]